MKGAALITLSNDGAFDGITDHDLAVLADWAGERKQLVPNPDWKRAFSLIREGADLLLRRRARSRIENAEGENVCK